MSFAIWRTKPPFVEMHDVPVYGEEDDKGNRPVVGTTRAGDLNEGEFIYAREGGVWKRSADVTDEGSVDLWCITTDGQPDPARVEATINPPAVRSDTQKLVDILVQKSVITPQDATTFEQAAVPDPKG